jgi:HD-like signal output (HDOD) protein/DNA-binding NarL/FixJ family response regulator
MTTDTRYQALVVEDEAAVRKLTLRALSQQGFSCDGAEDGLEGRRMIASHHYDVVVTDLRMPKLNGHALASELLVLKDRPLVVILTGMLEPRLAKDLIVRGADCIEFKPVNYDLFSAKVKALVDRRRKCCENGNGGDPISEGRGQAACETQQEEADPADSTAEASVLERKLAHLSKILPVSQAAFEVFNMTHTDSYEIPQITAAVARDASLSVDVLRLANSSFNNPSGHKIVELAEAILRVGQERVGELALANSALAALTANVLPWINGDLTWRRSVASGVVADLLLARKTYREAGEGLFLSAIMHPLGRIALGMVCPQRYRSLVELCRQSGKTLNEMEEQVFPLTNGQVLGRLLAAWNIPEEIYKPLNYLSNNYSAMAKVAEPLRTKVELLKLSILAGSIAIGEWESWDRLEFPLAPVLRRLGVDSLSKIIRDARTESEDIFGFRLQAPEPKGESGDAQSRKPPRRQLTYCNLSPEPFDFVGEIVASMGIELKVCEPDAIKPDDKILVNCIWNPPHRLAARVSPRSSSGAMLIVTDEHSAAYNRLGRTISLPTGYGALRTACEEIAHDREEGN